ncbi:hypothetical protein [Haloferula sp. A504]|uniref:hypothetical protein n=1 Tax=Haloferula sp. A504 TaxID=3373601 RepID=UPI0031C2BA3C|nr:hypothetical protein [Verrucomicrobiaceae bacterium E54]
MSFLASTDEAKDPVNRKLSLAIYLTEPPYGHNVNDLHIGTFLEGLTDEPRYLSGYVGGGEKGQIQIQVERTHEWELVIGLVVVGSGVFATGVLNELGRKSCEWLAGQRKVRDTRVNPEIRAQNGVKIQIPPEILPEVVEEVTQLMNSASKNGIQVELILKPDKD